MKKALLICTVLFGFLVQAQQPSTKVTSKRQQAYLDSLKTLDYNYVFPLLGEKVYHRGFDIPYPAGIMINSFWVKQLLEISSIELGVNNSGLADFSNLIKFSEVSATAYNTSIRPDLYILPFLNVYGVLGYSNVETRVVLSSPFYLESIVKLEGLTYGFGSNISMGVGSGFFVADFNMNWADLDLLEKPAMVTNASFRLGTRFVDQEKPWKNVAVWIGAFGSYMGGTTQGSISLSDALGDIDKLAEIKQNLQGRYEDWYNDLGIAQKLVVDQIVDEIDDRLNGIETNGLNVNYSLDKKPIHNWNLIIGFQYQFNKEWQFRMEAGGLGSRTQMLASLNYRFKI